MTNKERSKIIKALEYFHSDGEHYYDGIKILLDLIGAKSQFLEALERGTSVTIYELMKKPIKYKRK